VNIEKGYYIQVCREENDKI